MKLTLFLLVFSVGIVALSCVATAVLAYSRSDFETRNFCLKVFAVCVGVLVLLALVAAALGLPMTGFAMPRR